MRNHTKLKSDNLTAYYGRDLRSSGMLRGIGCYLVTVKIKLTLEQATKVQGGVDV